MLETLIRPALQPKLIDPVARWMHQTSLFHANQITLLSAILGTLICPLLWLNHPIFALVLLWISGYLDLLDGTLARLQKNLSGVGALYDLVSDRWVEFSIIFGFYLQVPTRAMGCLLMLGSVLLCVTSFLVVGALTENRGDKSFHYSPGLIERAEAFIFFSAMILFPSAFDALALIFGGLVIFTTLLRIHQFRRGSISIP